MILFLASVPLELKGLLKHCDKLRREHLPVQWAMSGIFRGKPMIAVANGAGPLRAYAAVGGPDLEMVLNLGLCGALDPALKIGDVVAATEVGGEPSLAPSSSPHCARGALVTADHVVRSAQEKRSLRLLGGLAVDMEARGARKRAKELGVPFYAVKCVSDLAEEELHCDFNRALRDDGRIDTVRLAMDAFKRPFTCLPELLRLGKRAALCSEKLGEFVASCEF